MPRALGYTLLSALVIWPASCNGRSTSHAPIEVAGGEGGAGSSFGGTSACRGGCSGAGDGTGQLGGAGAGAGLEGSGGFEAGQAGAGASDAAGAGATSRSGSGGQQAHGGEASDVDAGGDTGPGNAGVPAGGMGGDGAGAGSPASDAGAGGEPGSPALCPQGFGPTMVRLPEGYCIDSTEVTRAMYEAWLATQPAPADLPDAECDWNTDFFPPAECMAYGRVCQGDNCGDQPQVCVDWCDARAYCRAAGKRLCGKIGGGTISTASYADPTVSQWFNACSSHGKFEYPYGNTYDPAACNSVDSNLDTTTPVASMGTCQSSEPGYRGVFDLSGNVWEWEDSCDDVQWLSCAVRGGAFYMSGTANSCAWRAYNPPTNNGLGFIGFRCCSD
jgi:formylglycine-generating enzyme